MSDEAEIAEAEGHLRAAMLASDVSLLDRLLAPDLIFTNHLGQVLHKEDDLGAYRSGTLKLESLDTREQVVTVTGTVGIASVRVKIVGTYAGHPANGDFRFTRVWLHSDFGWQVIAAHASLLTT